MIMSMSWLLGSTRPLHNRGNVYRNTFSNGWYLPDCDIAIYSKSAVLYQLEKKGPAFNNVPVVDLLNTCSSV
jgi:hypothetical protein